MLLSLAVLLIGAGPEPGGAEAAFQKMEQQIMKAKSLQLHVEIVGGEQKNPMLIDMKGRLVVATGDRVRMELEGKVFGKEGKMAMVSDGKKQRTVASNRPAQDQDAKKQLSEIMLASIARGGVFVPMFAVVPDGPDKEEFDPAKRFPVSDFKMGKKEMIAGVEAQVIEYKLSSKAAKKPMNVTVWIDPKTDRLLKRVLNFSEGEEVVTITETYSKTVIDGKLDEKVFELPK